MTSSHNAQWHNPETIQFENISARKNTFLLAGVTGSSEPLVWVAAPSSGRCRYVGGVQCHRSETYSGRRKRMWLYIHLRQEYNHPVGVFGFQFPVMLTFASNFGTLHCHHTIQRHVSPSPTCGCCEAYIRIARVKIKLRPRGGGTVPNLCSTAEKSASSITVDHTRRRFQEREGYIENLWVSCLPSGKPLEDKN